MLFGDHNPCEQLRVTVPAHVGPSMRYWVGFGAYVDGGGAPLYPFGHGLSYRAFEYNDIEASEQMSHSAAVAEVSATVRNVGEPRGPRGLPALHE